MLSRIADQLLTVSGDCVKVISSDGRVLHVNEAGLLLLEFADGDSIVGRDWLSTWPENARPEVTRALQAAFNGSVHRFSAACPTATGTLKYWDVVASPLRLADGSIDGALIVSRDNTASILLQKVLLESEQRFRALADNMAQLAWITDGEGWVYWYNERWYNFTGTTLDEMKGWGWQKVVHPDFVERVSAKIKSCFESGEPWDDTFPLRGKDGTYRWFLSRANPVRDGAGKIVLWCGTNTDITEQRELSLRLRQLARLVELSHEAIMVSDTSGEVILWNKGCEDVYGFTRTEAIGKRPDELLHTRYPVDRERFLKEILERRSWRGEIEQVSKSGKVLWIETRLEVLEFDGATFVLETNRDATERKAAERSQSILIGELNHRVKNTLAIVQSIVTLMAKRPTDVGRFVSDFKRRLQSLAFAHDLLTEAQWKGAELSELIKFEAEARILDAARFGVSGDPVFLPPQLAIHFALIVHELTNNAIEHGALRGDQGRVNVTWAITGKDELTVEWRETGGPRLAGGAQSGYGTTLIDRLGSLPHLRTQLSYADDGFVCLMKIRLPAEQGNSRDDYFDVTSGRRARAS